MNTEYTLKEGDIPVDNEVIEYMDKGGGDYRISTTCSGPTLMSVKVKPPKESDIVIRAGNHLIYISRYQIEWIHEITMSLVPRFFT